MGRIVIHTRMGRMMKQSILLTVAIIFTLLAATLISCTGQSPAPAPAQPVTPTPEDLAYEIAREELDNLIRLAQTEVASTPEGASDYLDQVAEVLNRIDSDPAVLNGFQQVLEDILGAPLQRLQTGRNNFGVNLVTLVASQTTIDLPYLLEQQATAPNSGPSDERLSASKAWRILDEFVVKFVKDYLYPVVPGGTALQVADPVMAEGAMLVIVTAEYHKLRHTTSCISGTDPVCNAYFGGNYAEVIRLTHPELSRTVQPSPTPAPTPTPPPAPTPAPAPTPTPTPTPTTAITFTVPKELLPPATVGEPYSFSFATATNPSGGNPPYTFFLKWRMGSPPLGLAMDMNGKLSGTPIAKGTSIFEVCVEDVSGNQACATTSLTVAPPAITFTVPNPLPPATVGAPYEFDFSTTDNPAGGNPPYTFMIGSGEGLHPFELTLDADGLLNGTPTTAGIWEFEVIAEDMSGNQVYATTSLTVEEGPRVFTGSFSGTGQFVRPFPAYGTSCTFSHTFSGNIDLTMTLEADKTYVGSVSVSGTFTSIAISGGNAELTCIDSSTRWDSTNQISGTSPSIIWSTSFVTPGGSTVTGDFTGTLTGSSITGNMLVTLDSSTGSASIPITFTAQ